MTGREALAEIARQELAHIYGHRPSHSPAKKQHPRKRESSTRVLVEQAVARGESNRQIMRMFSLTYEELRVIRDEMNEDE